MSTSKIQTDANKAEVLLGIVMLAVSNALWQRDREAEANHGRDGLGELRYAVDSDIVKFFTDPKGNKKYLEIPGLLRDLTPSGTALKEEVQDHETATTILAQIMGHYIFLGSPHLGEKLIFPSTEREIDRLKEAIKADAYRSINRSHTEMVQAQSFLDNLIADYFRKKNTTPESFIEHSVRKLEVLYPAIFSKGPVREFKRLGDLLGSARSNHLYSAADVREIAQALSALEQEKQAEISAQAIPLGEIGFHQEVRGTKCEIGMLPWRVIHSAWQNAFADTSPEGGRSEEVTATDVDTFATIEWCNRWL